MSQITSAPYVLRDVILRIGATDTYEAHVSRVAFTPSSGQVTWQGLTPAAKFAGQTDATWVCEVTGVQDWETANSLAEYLWDHEGEEVPVEFTPRNGIGSKFATSVTVAAPSVGGDVNTVPQFTVSMGCAGKPARTAVGA